jgi:hypothetical protein
MSFGVWMTGELVEATLFVAEGEEHKIIDLISSGVTAGFGSSLLSGSYGYEESCL